MPIWKARRGAQSRRQPQPPAADASIGVEMRDVKQAARPSRHKTARRRRTSLRRGLILVTLLALVPITLISITQGIVRLENRRAPVVRQLSASATILARNNAAILDDTATLLRVIALNPAATSGPDCGEFLAARRALVPANANLMSYGPDGRLTCAAIAPKSPLVAQHAWWQLVQQDRKPTIGGAHFDTLSRRLVIDLAVPLHDSADRFDGALVAAIDLDWLMNRMRERLPGANNGVALLDASGKTLLADRPLPKFDPTTPPGTIKRVRDTNGVSWSYVLVPLVQAGPGQRALDVVYATPDAALFGLAEWQSLMDFMLPVLAIMLATLAIWIGTERLVLRWLRSLQKLALQFASGDYRRRPTRFLAAPREMRSAAAALYRMSIAVEERDRTVNIVVDMSASTEWGSTPLSKREVAAEVAAVVAFAAIKNHDRVGLYLVTDRVELFVPPKKGRRHVMRLVAEILGFAPQHRGSRLAVGFETLNKTCARRSVVMVVSDFLSEAPTAQVRRQAVATTVVAPPWEMALRITAQRHDVIAAVIADRAELALPDVGLVAMEDLESGAIELVDTSAMGLAYQRRTAQWTQARDSSLQRAGVDTVTIRTDQQYLSVLVRFFRERALAKAKSRGGRR